MRTASLVTFLLTLGLAAWAPAFSAPAKEPTRPGATSTTGRTGAHQAPAGKTATAQYQPVDILCKRFGLKLVWLNRTEGRFALRSRGKDLVFELNSRDCQLLGLRVLLGDPVRELKGEPALSRIDLERLVTPLLRPGYGVPRPGPVRTIVLDPGHGGKDTGKINERLKLHEKELTLDTARRLRRLLEAQDYRVVLTRDKDVYLELPERPEIAQRVQADLFISLHFNSVESGAERVTGAETFTMTPQHQLSTDREPDQYVKVANPGNAHDHWNATLGAFIHRALLEELKIPDRGLKRGRLAVLRLAPCPAVLVEAGYLSNEAEAKRLAEPAYRQRVAEAVAQGVRAYSIAREAARRR